MNKIIIFIVSSPKNTIIRLWEGLGWSDFYSNEIGRSFQMILSTSSGVRRQRKRWKQRKVYFTFKWKPTHQRNDSGYMKFQWDDTFWLQRDLQSRWYNKRWIHSQFHSNYDEYNRYESILKFPWFCWAFSFFRIHCRLPFDCWPRISIRQLCSVVNH